MEERHGQAGKYWSGRRLLALGLALVLTLAGTVGVLAEVRAVERFPIPGAKAGLPLPEGISGSEAAPETGDQTTAEATDPPEPEKGDSAEALAAYLELLREKREDIEGYYWQKGGYRRDDPNPETAPRPVALVDCWGDELPELVYVDVDAGEQYVFQSTLHIVTWEEGLRTLYECRWDVLAGGGFRYYLYQTEGSKALCAYASYGDEHWTTRYSRLTQRNDGLEEEILLERISKPNYENGAYNAIVTCTKEGTEISEEAFDAAVAEHEGHTDVIVMSSREATPFAAQTVEQAGELARSLDELLFELLDQTAADSGETSLDPELLPQSLLDFLLQFVGWYSDGNGGVEFRAESAAVDGSNLLASLVNNGACVRYRLYPGEGQKDYWNEADPRGWAEGSYPSYASYDAESVDWIARHIFHLTEEALAKLIAQGEAEHCFYRQADESGKEYYYRPIGGVGDPFLKVVPYAVSLENGRYTVRYDVYFDVADGQRYPSDQAEYEYSACAQAGWEEIEGSFYWTLYSNSAQSREEAEPVPDPELFRRMPGFYRFTSGMGGWGTMLVLQEDGSFLGSFSDANLGESGPGYDGTVYYADFTGRFVNPRQIDPWTWAFDLAELEVDREHEAEEIVSVYGANTRFVRSGAYGLEGGQTFYYYAAGAPNYRVPQEYRSWAYAYEGRNGTRLSHGGIYNEAQKQGLVACWEETEAANWEEAYRDFTLQERYFSYSPARLGFGGSSQNENPPSFSLTDRDGDGQPELAVYNGQPDEARRAWYLYRFRDGRVRFLETLDREAAAALGLPERGVSLEQLRQTGWASFAADWYGGPGGTVRTISVPGVGGEEASLSWGWSLFGEDPEALSPALAKACALLCGGDPAKVLTGLGFTEPDRAESDGFTADFGARLLRRDGVEQMVLAIVLRPAAGEDSYGLLPQLQQLSQDAARHLSVRFASYLESLAASYDFVNENSRVLVCGWGSAGAVAGELTPLLRGGFAAEKGVYAYTYGCPRYRAPGSLQEDWGCVHNLIHRQDLAALLPWDLERPGQSLYLNGTEDTAAKAHELRALLPLLEQLEGGAEQCAPERLQRLRLTEAGELSLLDRAGKLLSLHTDGSARSSPDGAILVLPEPGGCGIYSFAGTAYTLVLPEEAGKAPSLLRETADAVSGAAEILCSLSTLQPGAGEAWCVPVEGNEIRGAAVYEVDRSGKTLTRISAAGEASAAVFGNNTLGWSFAGLTALGLLGIVLSLLLRRRR